MLISNELKEFLEEKEKHSVPRTQEAEIQSDISDSFSIELDFYADINLNNNKTNDSI